ncbi:hypothetical protein SVIOM74S_10369 [Streptomyces violarus]
MATEYGQGYGLDGGPGLPRRRRRRRAAAPDGRRRCGRRSRAGAWREVGYALLSLPISVLLFTVRGHDGVAGRRDCW